MYTNGHSVDVPLVQWILTEASKHTDHQYYEPNEGKEKYRGKETKGDGEEEGGREGGREERILPSSARIQSSQLQTDVYNLSAMTRVV